MPLVPTNIVVRRVGDQNKLIERTDIVRCGAWRSTVLSSLVTDFAPVLVATLTVPVNALAEIPPIANSCFVVPFKLRDEFDTIVIVRA